MLRSLLKISGGVLAVLIGAAVVLGLHDMVSFGADPPADPHGSAAARLARVAARPTLRLTHRGRHTGKSYAVTIWFVTDGDVVYLTTMDRRRQWVRNVSHSPRVRLEIGRERFDGTVRPVTAEAEKRREFELLAQKYWIMHLMNVIVRLTGRDRAANLDLGRGGFFRVQLDAPAP